MSTYLELPMNRINLLRLTKVHNKAYAQLKRRKHVKDHSRLYMLPIFGTFTAIIFDYG